MTVIAGLVLAGGKSSRMGQDKAGLEFDGQTLLARAVARLAPQVTTVAVSANMPGHSGTEFPVLADTISGHQGPLAGILAGLEWAATLKPAPTHLAVVPVDAPFFPDNLVAKLAAHADENTICLAESCGKNHPVFSLWPVRYAELLHIHFAAGGTRKLMDYVETCHHWIVDFPVSDGLDPFLNINTKDDFETAQKHLA